MAKSPKRKRVQREVDSTGDAPSAAPAEGAELATEEPEGGESTDVLPQGQLVCRLTGDHKPETEDEKTLQSLIEQLHREYRVEFGDMERDIRHRSVTTDAQTGRERGRMRRIALAVYEHGKDHEIENLIRVVLVAPSRVKIDNGIDELDEILGSLPEERGELYGLWTNGVQAAFRMRTYDLRTGEPRFEQLSDFPAPDETLADLETADRRSLRVAGGDSLQRTFKRCHDYLYGNQSMRGDKAFWQLLNLIFCKIYDEKQSRRRFFVGATEANSDEGQARIAIRVKELFEKVKSDGAHGFKDVFEGNEKIELNDRALAFIAGELGRYDFLRTDADAKGLAYETITSTTLKRERGQFFTPRNVIQMMVRMCDPQPGQKVLDPACGSGGFLVVALHEVQRRLYEQAGADPDCPLPAQRKRIEGDLRKYARDCLFGIDVDADLRKAARMNMVMNGDGHGHIYSFNSLEYGVPGREIPEMGAFEKASGGHDSFDFVFTNPPFGAKIPVGDPKVLDAFDLGHAWTTSGGNFTRAGLLSKVPPEILFIEACCRYLKPGTGILGIVLPDGILGNPGIGMEAVRAWMLRTMELLASVDLPGETFLPQVSVQASCVFLRRRHSDERKLAGKGPKQHPVFMAIAEKVGHGRRGETLYVRGSDGVEEEEDAQEKEICGGAVVTRKVRRKRLADDLPWIAAQYRKFIVGKKFEAE